MDKWRTAFIALAAAVVAGTGGYFAGRWHVKREIAGAMESAFADVGKAFTSGMSESLTASPAVSRVTPAAESETPAVPPKPEPKPWEGAGEIVSNGFIRTGTVQVFREAKDFGIALPFVNASKSEIVDAFISDVRDEFGNRYYRQFTPQRERYIAFWKQQSSVKGNADKIRPGDSGTALNLCDVPVDAARTLFVEVHVSGDAIKSESYWVKIDLPTK